MKHRRISRRRATLAGAGIAALVTAGMTFQSANASEVTKVAEPKALSVLAAGKIASTLGKDLGADVAGTYYDAKARNLVVNVRPSAAGASFAELAEDYRSSLTKLFAVLERPSKRPAR